MRPSDKNCSLGAQGSLEALNQGGCLPRRPNAMRCYINRAGATPQQGGSRVVGNPHADHSMPKRRARPRQKDGEAMDEPARRKRRTYMSIPTASDGFAARMASTTHASGGALSSCKTKVRARLLGCSDKRARAFARATSRRALQWSVKTTSADAGAVGARVSAT